MSQTAAVPSGVIVHRRHPPLRAHWGVADLRIGGNGCLCHLVDRELRQGHLVGEASCRGLADSCMGRAHCAFRPTLRLPR